MLDYGFHSIHNKLTEGVMKRLDAVGHGMVDDPSARVQANYGNSGV